MSLQSILLRRGAAKSDRERDSKIPYPTGVIQRCNISYGPYGKSNLLDVYRPDDRERYPILINVHGGGYVYGSKEVYKRYCMELARHGFTVININYRLAPRWKFPAPLEDIHNVMLWIQREKHNLQADWTRIFMVGDSAGAQLVSQYAAMLTNADYMALFGFSKLDDTTKLHAIGLNCGMYDAQKQAEGQRKGIARDYLGRKLSASDPRLFVLDAITSNFPPAHITTACHDFLRDAAQPMYDLLVARNVPCRMDCYGKEEDPSVGHVFHINIITEDAIQCNADQCDFFKQYI
jgi:acetyl esterase/lipase